MYRIHTSIFMAFECRDIHSYYYQRYSNSQSTENCLNVPESNQRYLTRENFLVQRRNFVRVKRIFRGFPSDSSRGRLYCCFLDAF